MREYIDRQEILKIADKLTQVDMATAFRMINNLPKISEEKLIKSTIGKWVDTHKVYCGAVVYQCSVCKSEIDDVPLFLGKPMYFYCPYCGVEMDGERRINDD